MPPAGRGVYTTDEQPLRFNLNLSFTSSDNRNTQLNHKNNKMKPSDKKYIRTSTSLVIAASMALCSLQAQTVHYRFTGTVDGNGLEGKFTPPESPIPGLEVNDGDLVTGSFNLVEELEETFGRTDVSYGSVTDFRVSLNGHDLIPRNAPPGDRLWIDNGKGPRPWNLETTPLAKEGDVQAVTTSIGGVAIPLGSGETAQIAIVLNFTDSTANLIDAEGRPKRITLEDYDVAKGFIRTIVFPRGTPGVEGIMFNIDSLEQAEQPVELSTGFHVAWRADADGLNLEEAESAEGPWLASSGVRATADGMNIVVMDLQSRSKLFRLVEFKGDPNHHVFTDPKTGYQTTDLYDVNGDIVQIDTRNQSMVWEQNETSYFEGRYTVTDDVFLRSDRFFQVRFGTENGERKAFFTETAARTICNIRLLDGNLRISATGVRVPNP